MKLTKNKLFSGILFFGLITILLVLFNVQYFYLRAIFSFIFLTTIPGLLIMLMLRIRKIEFWEYLVYTIGLSIAFLMFAGLAVNWTLPWLHVTDKPLSLMPLLLSFDIILSIFGLIAYRRNKKISMKISLPKRNRLNIVFITFPIIFPILSILGANLFNNNVTNIVTILLILLLGSYFLLIIFLRNKISLPTYVITIYMISLSVLLMYSMRSSHLLGWDINEEYYVFQLTNKYKLWNLYNNNPYNSCLSITILPTVISSFTGINPEYIFKLFMQFILALQPLVMLMLFRKFTSNTIAFISSFLFISQTWFFMQISAMLRQGVAFFFLSLLLVVTFNKSINKNKKYFLILLFGLSLILSHYTTNYIWLLASFISILVVKALNAIKLLKIEHSISLRVIVILILFTFLWNSQITNSTNNITDAIGNIKEFILNELKDGNINTAIEQLTFKDTNINTNSNVIKYYETMTKYYKTKDEFILYNISAYKNYKPEVIQDNTSFNLPSSIVQPLLFLFKINKILIVVIFPVVGILYLMYKLIKKDRKYYNSYIFLSLGFLFIILLSLLITKINTTYYSITRTYMETLVILSYPTVVGGLLVFSRFKKKNILIVSCLTILFFYYSYGIVFKLVGIPSYPHLDNNGGDYNNYYTLDSEVASSVWLSNIRLKTVPVFADEVASLRLIAYGGINNEIFDILPSTIDIRSYVYLSATNYKKDIAFKGYGNGYINYTYPISFLNENKNLIYNNGESVIYK